VTNVYKENHLEDVLTHTKNINQKMQIPVTTCNHQVNLKNKAKRKKKSLKKP
jgi:hypothetical protein